MAKPEHDLDEKAAVVSINSIHPWSGNPRANRAAVQKIATSIRQFGFASPIIARRENGEIIAGHTRYFAAKRLKLERVPVRYLDLSEEESHKLALADNRLGEEAEWDDEMLADELKKLSEFDVGQLGFDEKEISRLLDDGVDADDEDYANQELERDIFEILVSCKDEAHQRELLGQLTALGLDCRALIA